MKSIFASFIAVSAMVLSAQAADVTAKLADVHICCKSCVTIAQKTVAKVPGVKADVNEEESTITLTGPSTASVQKAVNALVNAGFYGKSDNAGIMVHSATGAKGEKVQSLEVSNVHLCCGKCVKAVNAAAMSVPGVTGTTAAKDAKTFTVTGDFTDTALFAALQKVGLTGKVVAK